jgi:Chemotaxis response regulator containing a CheY-like receiver domain and a methylesterase domain
MAPYRILVVDDSAFMRKIVSDLIMQDTQFEIAGTVSNGAEAVAEAARLKPDAITMDLEMPVMNGIDALQLIMKDNPVPVIMLSGISEANTRDTIRALQYGALDFIRKPTSPVTDDIRQVGELLLEKLRVAVSLKRAKSRTNPPKQEAAPAIDGSARASGPKPAVKPDAGRSAGPLAPPLHKLTEKPAKSPAKSGPQAPPAPVPPAAAKAPQRPAGTLEKSKDNKVAPPAKPEASHNAPPPAGKKIGSATFRQIVAIGTSTGGPRALHEVISSLPADFPAPVLVVQHMPPKFTKSLAQRLDSFSPLQVVEAEHGMRVSAGTVYIAPGGRHLQLSKDGSGYTIALSDEPQRNGHRPSVDVMFESLLPFRELKRHAVLMTGMGSDGAKGMKQLAEGGGVSTMAESEETCVVYGMPRSAIEGGFVQSVVPLHQIAHRLVELTGQQE